MEILVIDIWTIEIGRDNDGVKITISTPKVNDIWCIYPNEQETRALIAALQAALGEGNNGTE